MFAIIKTGGKQYIVSPGDKIKVEKLEIPEGGEVIFDNVLLVFQETTETTETKENTETKIGTPYLKDYIVKGKILKQGKGKKIIVYKYKAKKRYHKKQGHRQLFSEVEIVSIGGTRSPSGVKKVGKKTKSATLAKNPPAIASRASEALRAGKVSATKKKPSRKENVAKTE